MKPETWHTWKNGYWRFSLQGIEEGHTYLKVRFNYDQPTTGFRIPYEEIENWREMLNMLEKATKK